MILFKKYCLLQKHLSKIIELQADKATRKDVLFI